jgi:hypothetical protein
MVESIASSPALLLGALIFVIALAAAILIGIVVYVVKARSRAQAERAPASSSSPSPSRAAQPQPGLKGEGAGTWDEPPLLQSPNRPGEVMRIIRDQDTGRILVEVEGQSYTHIREIADAQAGRRVLWAIADLIRFTGGMATNAQAVRSAAQSVAREQGISTLQDAGHVETVQAGTSETAAAGPAPSSALAEPSALSQSDRDLGPRYSVSAFFQRGLRPPSLPTPELGTSSFIDEIEAILQGLIAERTAPLARAVHVSVGPEDRLQIEVGSEVYGSADEVPDPEVQALIRAAVAEWENR